MRRGGPGTRPFALTALAAARRWRRAQARIGRSRAAWVPLALRWRRLARARPAALARDPKRAGDAAIAARERRAEPGGGIARVVRERLTFATSAREIRTRSREQVRLVVATTLRERHAFTRLAVQRDRPDAGMWRRRDGMRDWRAAVREGAAARDATIGSRAYGHAAIGPPVPGATRGLPPMRRPSAMRVTQSATSEAAARTAHRMAHRDAVARVPAASVAALQRTAPLVWRQHEDRRDATPRTVATARAPVAPDSMAPRPPTSIHDATPQRAPAAPPSQSPAVPRLDPAFVDRLAEDVIRRVDKRARIERERRGL